MCGDVVVHIEQQVDFQFMVNLLWSTFSGMVGLMYFALAASV